MPRNVFVVVGFLFYFNFQTGRDILESLGWPGTHSVDLAGLELTDVPASASRVSSGIGVCAVTYGLS